MAKLITGGTGFVGSELAHMLVDRGEDVVVFDRTIKRHRIDDIEDRIRLVQGDLSNWSTVFNAVKDNGITRIYHLGSMLTNAAQANPWGAFQSNIIGTYNVLEAARMLEVERVMFASTIGTFNLEAGAEITDTTIQRPVTFYGVGKLWGEGVGRFYRTKFGLDFRSIRYPAVTGPGVKTPDHWWIPMIENAIRGKPSQCTVTEETRVPLMFFKDAARAADLVVQAPKENIKMVNYNVGGDTAFTSAKEIELAIRRHIPDAVITYCPDPAFVAQMRGRSHMKSIDDGCARKEWGWMPAYDGIDKIIAAFVEELRAHPRRYGQE